MAVSVDKLAKDMVKVVGEEHVFTDKATRMVFATGPVPFDIEEHNIPYAVVRPSNAEGVSQILKYANKESMPVHIHGSGTSLRAQFEFII